MTIERDSTPADFTPGLVSVVMAARDASQWIADALASIEAQDYRPLEVLLVDDGSRDDTFVDAARFASRINLRIIHEQGVR